MKKKQKYYPYKRAKITAKAVLFTIFISCYLSTNTVAQELTRTFKNLGNDTIVLKIDGKVLEKIPSKTKATLKVNYKDRIDIEVPSKPAHRWYPIYINEMKDRGSYSIKARTPFDDQHRLTRGGVKAVKYFEQNLNGIRIDQFDPYVVGNSFLATKIFKGLESDSYDYQTSTHDFYLSDGFLYNGDLKVNRGQDKEKTHRRKK